MNLNKLIKNKGILLILLILNLVGIIASYITYFNSAIKYIELGTFYIVPFFMVSFWLFFLAFIFVLYLYLDLEVPKVFANLTFIYCFVYGVGSFLFYPLFMIFVNGFSIYHSWNVVAHGFVGLQSLLFLYYLKKINFIKYLSIIALFLLKDILDLFFNSFLYFIKYAFPIVLKQVLIFMIIGLQVVAFYLVYNKEKRLK